MRAAFTDFANVTIVPPPSQPSLLFLSFPFLFLFLLLNQQWSAELVLSAKWIYCRPSLSTTIRSSWTSAAVVKRTKTQFEKKRERFLRVIPRFGTLCRQTFAVHSSNAYHSFRRSHKAHYFAKLINAVLYRPTVIFLSH